jgi:hypoxanthine phosphoribosyltransferase
MLDKTQCLYDLADIESALDETAEKINQHFDGQSVLVMSILKGGLVVSGHLLTRLKFSITLDVVQATRYRGGTLGYDLEWKKYPETDLEDKTILLIDDIFDEGVTLELVKNYCTDNGAKEVVSVVLLDKLHDRKPAGFRPDYVSLTVPDVYVFGFGLDYSEGFRNLPGIYSFT